MKKSRTGGRGRKPCPGCGTHVGCRTEVCDCGHQFFKNGQPAEAAPKKNLLLSDAEAELVAGVEYREKVVRGRIAGIVLPNYQGVKGFFLHGPAGHGKSEIITTELKRRFGPDGWQHYNSDVSAAALANILEKKPEAVFFFEDCEPLYKDRTAQGLLRSALAPPHLVTRTISGREMRFTFSGAIIIASNLPLNEGHGVLGAIASRTGPVRWELTRLELGAMMHQIAMAGYKDGNRFLTPEECWEVADFCITAMDDGGRLDLRIFCDAGLPARLKWKHGDLPIQWTDYVLSWVHSPQVTRIESRAEKGERLQHIACEIFLEGRTAEERFELWEERSGEKSSSFYNWLNRAKARGLFDQYQKAAG
jgi:hypothetical protein